MIRVGIIIGLVVAAAAAWAEPGEVKIGALVPVANSDGSDNKRDMELVEFAAIYDSSGDSLVTFSLGGSCKGKSFGVATLANVKHVGRGFTKGLAWVTDKIPGVPRVELNFDALDFEVGVYIARDFERGRFVVDGAATMFSYKIPNVNEF